MKAKQYFFLTLWVGVSMFSAVIISACSSSNSSSSTAGAIPAVSVKCGDEACVK